MKLEASKGFKLEWEGKEYTLKKPKVKESMDFYKAYAKLPKDDAVAQVELSITQLDSLGLPREVVEEMELPHIKAIQELLLGDNNQGK